MTPPRSSHMPSLIFAALLVLAGCGQNLTATEHVEKAKDYMDKGELRPAMIELSSAVQKDPNSVEGRWLLAKVAVDMGEGPRAEKEIRKAMELGLNRASGQYTLVESLLLQGDFDRALQESSVLAPNISKADQAAVLGLRGQAYIAKSQLDLAQQTLEQALQIKPDSIPALIGMTALQGYQRHYDVARQWVDKALKADPTSPDAWGALGDLEMAQRRLVEAEKAYGQAIEHRAAPFVEQVKRAQVRIQLKKYSEAAADIKALREAGLKDHPYVNYVAGLNDFAQKRYQEALASFQASYAANPNYLSNRVYLATTQLYLGNTEQALSHAQQIAAAAPRSITAQGLLGSVLISRGEYEDAKDALKAILAKSPNDPQALGMMATVALREGNTAKGLEYAIKYAGLVPNSKQAQDLLLMAKLMAGEALDQTIDQTGKQSDASKDVYTQEFMLALADFRDGKLKEAFDRANALHARYPDKVDPPKLIAAVYLASGQWDKAKVEFEKVLKIDPYEPSALKSLAKIELQAGNTQRAKTLLQAQVKAQPNDQTAALLLADMETRLGDRAAAITVLEQIVKRDPNALTARAKLAQEYLRAGNVAKTLETTRNLSTEQIQKQPALLELRGRAQMLAGDAKSARKTFEQWTKVSPNSAPAHFYYSDSLARTGDTAGSQKELARSVKLDSKYLPARLGEIRVLVGLREIEKAKKGLVKLKQDFGKHPEVLAVEGSFALSTGDHAKAVQVLSDAYRLQPDTESVMLLSRAHMAQKNADQAARLLQAWLKDHPQDMQVLLLLAGDYMALGKDADARATYESIIKIHPNHVPALNNLAWLNRNNDLKKAIGYAEQAYQLAPKAAFVMDTLGTLLLKSGNIDRGYSLISQAAKSAPGNQQIQLHLGEALIKQKRYSQARDVISAVVKKAPGTPTAKEGQALLNSIRGMN